MNNIGCIKCGTGNSLKSYSFLTVNVHSSSSTSGRRTTTTTTESLNGAASCVVCSDCIRRKRITNAIGMGIGTLICVFIAVILFGAFIIGKNYYNSHFGKVALFALAAGIVAAVIVLIVSLQKEDAFVAAMIKKSMDRKTDPAAAARVYIPMDPSLYVNKQTNNPEISVFTRKTGLKTALSATLFVLVLAGGINTNGPTETAEPAMPAAPEAPAAPVRTAAPPASTDDLLNQSVLRLLELYRKKPEGFLKAQAGEVRAVGEQLNAAGGMNLMLQAHQAFQARNPQMARNLEIVWDGIGSWMG